ncbi:Uu.00g035340.m01.CDS01 [Anthostomella pinea]|uniref:Uu.00g035340.m01.CDS01 n=1 Tax=Anthostomella pinea TaxID=933095 RepID=A0AAI8VA89_9PEZI|nr:Uu.00g035340.m01.CDS01 [Anthostomella pinea]
MSRCKGTGEFVQLDDTFAAYTRDIIAAICYEDEAPMVEDAGKSAEWHNMTMNLVYQQPVAVHLPFLMKLVRILPDAILKLYPAGGTCARLRSNAIDHIETAKKQNRGMEAALKDVRSSMLRHMLLDKDLPQSEKSTDRLAQELMNVVGAGGSTPGTALTITTYHILSNPRVENKLRQELAGLTVNFPTEVPQLTDLERLPYLQACLKEGLRMGPGAIRRTPRCFPDDDVVYKDYVIPKNTPIGIATYYMHNDPEVFPEPFEFRPERWLADDISLLKRNWVPFSRGARGCAGINLAMSELSLGISTLFRADGPKLRLYETERRDIQPCYDRIIGVPAPDARGLRVTVH